MELGEASTLRANDVEFLLDGDTFSPASCGPSTRGPQSHEYYIGEPDQIATSYATR